ncbi:MAG: acyl-CoA dehydrogenase family protein, partial [Bifidobacteriaceae bacterium]|nr:acyl-CoA dehydrogenase family protein [Bifidobacteriaceae bacterium]
MLLKFTDEQQLLLDSLEEILDRIVTPEYCERVDVEGREPREFNEAMVEAGFATLGIPEEFGGTPIDNLTLAIICERVCQRGLQAGYGGAIMQV